MNSLKAMLSTFDLKAQIKLERQTHKGAFLLVEGSTDAKRFRKFVSSPHCSVVVCGGRENVEMVAADLGKKGDTSILGLIDIDFDILLKREIPSSNIVTSKKHDFDLDVFSSQAFARYLSELGDEQKILELGGIEAIRNHILNFLKPVSALRFVNVAFKLGYRLNDLTIGDFVASGNINIDAMINAVSSGKFSSADHKEKLKARISACLKKEIDLWHFTNGHDVFQAVSYYCDGLIGSRRGTQNHPKEIERVIRLTFDQSDLEEIGLAQKIRAWESKTGFKIFR